MKSMEGTQSVSGPGQGSVCWGPTGQLPLKEPVECSPVSSSVVDLGRFPKTWERGLFYHYMNAPMQNSKNDPPIHGWSVPLLSE